MVNEVTLSVAPAGEVAVLDLWPGADRRDLAGIDAVQVEPDRWWLFGAVDPGLGAEPIGGGLVRATLTGPGWRALLMIAGVFDAEDPAFGPGDCAATVIHHVPVWIVPRGGTAGDCAHVFFAASYAEGLVRLWTAAIDRGVA